MTTASQTAKAFLKLSQPELGDLLTNLKLQKLIYYAQGFHLAIHGKPLFNDEILAWEHGPVVRTVYNAYRDYGSEPIPMPEGEVKLTAQEVELIAEVNNVYGQFSAWKLRDMTHKEAPWLETARDQVISHEKLTTYFRTLTD